MNVFDFDGTLYDGDSTLDFYLHCLKKHPTVLSCLPYQLLSAIKYVLGAMDKTRFKECFYCFFEKVPDTEAEARLFWDSHKRRLYSWYKEIHQDGDVVISASPDFLVREICGRIGISHVIASKVDARTGKYNGLNCYGSEKIIRFLEMYPDGIIESFYTDSSSDLPLARLSQASYQIIKGRPVRWNLSCEGDKN